MVHPDQGILDDLTNSLWGRIRHLWEIPMMRVHLPQSPPKNRRGMTAIEMLLTATAVIVLASLVVPVILYSREAARRSTCTSNLAALSRALLVYHDQHETLPPAAVWSTTEFRSLALQQNKRWDRFIRANWAVSLLPQLNQQALANLYDPSLPIAASQHAGLRMTQLASFICPSDEFNRADNPYRYEPVAGTITEFARGNYGLNGGTNSFHTTAGSTTTPTGDHAHLFVNAEKREFQYWGNGIAGFNRAFRLADFQNGASTLVAVEEIRAGVHAVDPRGAWGLGHIAASVTWGHGVNGDATGPNNPWARSDDIQGCAKLHEVFGPEELVRLGMPCVSYLDDNQNATSRSQHAGGVNVAFLDGAVRFIRNDIDPGLWHVIHARETPADILVKDFATRLAWTGAAEEAARPRSATTPPDTSRHSPQASQANSVLTPGETQQEPQQVAPKGELRLPVVKNAVGMEFIQIPAGKFLMGTPDPGNNGDLPPESPPHQVRITTAFQLARTEVTQEQYQTIMGENPSWHQPPRVADGWSLQFPVENVTWQQAAEFCRKLSELPEERSAGRSYRLPTEGEWEYACRAIAPVSGKDSKESKDEHHGDMAGITPPKPIVPVGSFPANRFGLVDMRGNAWEWCSDWFDRDYYLRSRSDDPAGPAEGYLKVVRGADWIYVGEGCFINYPILAPWKSSRVIGFRVVCENAAQASATKSSQPDNRGTN